jgi:hypothetical protein
MMIDFVKFVIREYGLILLPIIVSICGVLYSNHFSRSAVKKSAALAKEANEKAEEANALAREALKNSEKQFVEMNRPQLTAQPLMQDNRRYYELAKSDENRIYAALQVVIQNKGNVVASSTLIEEATFQINYRGARIAYARNYYDSLGNTHPTKEAVPTTNFTLIDIQPQDGYAKKLEFMIDLSSAGFSADEVLHLFLDLAATINLRLLFLLRHIILTSCEGCDMQASWKKKPYFSG